MGNIRFLCVLRGGGEGIVPVLIVFFCFRQMMAILFLCIFICIKEKSIIRNDSVMAACSSYWVRCKYASSFNVELL